jgi:hypothetical protein
MYTVGIRRAAAALALAASLPASAETPPPTSIGQLLAEGWEIAGYAPSLAMVGSVILFRHKDKNYLVQCTAVFDATRSQSERVVTHCYQIR